MTFKPIELNAAPIRRSGAPRRYADDVSPVRCPVFSTVSVRGGGECLVDVVSVHVSEKQEVNEVSITYNSVGN
jgi:hypothetical protein